MRSNENQGFLNTKYPISIRIHSKNGDPESNIEVEILFIDFGTKFLTARTIYASPESLFPVALSLDRQTPCNDSKNHIFFLTLFFFQFSIEQLQTNHTANMSPSQSHKSIS
ncbi:unnamed protein product [Parnassius mnemosyne]|uniref:Uncharacterized protein n=1 Tax=Parnassius mnemosyne TaxID=213953 RepID=A0AAV1M5D7_9NEOP